MNPVIHYYQLPASPLAHSRVCFIPAKTVPPHIYHMIHIAPREYHLLPMDGNNTCHVQEQIRSRYECMSDRRAS